MIKTVDPGLRRDDEEKELKTVKRTGMASTDKKRDQEKFMRGMILFFG